ncbi:MAG: AzlC family ABC transporter permease [Bilophila wadsworthia]
MSDTIESTVMAEPKASSSSAILTGMKRGFPIFLGYVPLGFAYGVLAVQNNIPAVYAVLFSLLVYAGAGQFIAVGLWGMGASVFSIVFTTFVINLRHVLMSAAVAPWFAPFTRFQQFIIGWGLTDEVFAMHSMAMATGEKARLPLVYAANFTSHSGWVLGTFIGAVAGDFLPDPKLFGLDTPCPPCSSPCSSPVQGTAVHAGGRPLGALSVILAMYDTGRWNVIIASVITSTIGALLVTHRDRNIDALRRKHEHRSLLCISAWLS